MTEHVSTPDTGIEALALLIGIAFSVFLFFIILRLVRRNLARTGFSSGQVTLIIWGTLIGSLIAIPLFPFGAGYLGVNVGGALIPIFLSLVFIKRRQVVFNEALVGIALVGVASYLVTDYVPGTGVISPFPLWLIPPLVAALVAVFAFWRDGSEGAALAYVAGTMGTLLGADIVRLPEILAGPAPEEPVILAIGGAGVFDMVFLAGIIAVALQATDILRRASDRIEDAVTSRSFRHSIDVEDEFARWMRDQRARRAELDAERDRFVSGRGKGAPRPDDRGRAATWSPVAQAQRGGSERRSRGPGPSTNRTAAGDRRTEEQERREARGDSERRARRARGGARAQREAREARERRPSSRDTLAKRRQERRLEARRRREERRRRMDEMRPTRGRNAS